MLTVYKAGDLNGTICAASNCNIVMAKILLELDVLVGESKPTVVKHRGGWGVDDDGRFKCR